MIAFLLTGALAAAVNFGSHILFGRITAFFLAGLFVFKDGSRSLHHSAFYSVLVNSVAVLQTWVVEYGTPERRRDGEVLPR